MSAIAAIGTGRDAALPGRRARRWLPGSPTSPARTSQYGSLPKREISQPLSPGKAPGPWRLFPASHSTRLRLAAERESGQVRAIGP